MSERSLKKYKAMNETESSKSNTRDRIINAALFIAAKEGFAKATTQQIAAKAGVSEGIIYHYFKSKYDLCRDMIKERAEEFRQSLIKEIKRCATSKDRLDKLIDFHFTYYTGKGNIFQVIYGKSGDTTIMMGHILKVAIIPYVKIIEALIREGVKEGEFKALNPNIAASSLLGMMQITIIRLHFGFARFSIKDAKAQIKRIFFEGLLCRR